MPAGDLVVVNYQLELRTKLHGRTTNVHFDEDASGVQGLFDDTGTAVETEYAHAPGSFIGDVRRPARTVTAALLVVGDDEEAVADEVISVQTAWAPSADPSVEEELWFQWPGFGKRYVVGQPLGAVVGDFTKALILRRVPVLATFRITDPTIHTP